MASLGATPRSAAAADAPGAPARPLRILILGGTGFTGPHQVRYALARGHKVTLFNRGRQPKEWPGEVEELLGDRNTGDLKALEGREWDVCIDNPTTLPFWVRDAGKVLRGKVQQYVFISTVSVYAANDKPDDEIGGAAALRGRRPDGRDARDAACQARSSTARSRRRAKPRRRASSATATTIIRPGLIVGPGDETDRFTYWPVRLARGGEVLAPGDGSDPVQFVDARDLAEWTIRMAETRTTGIFNATGPARDARDARHARRHRRGDPRPTRATPGCRPTSWKRRRYRRGATCRSGCRAKATAPASRGAGSTAPLRAGLTFRPLTTTAVDTLAWFRQQPEARQAKPKTGLTPAREAEVLERLEGEREEAGIGAPRESRSSCRRTRPASLPPPLRSSTAASAGVTASSSTDLSRHQVPQNVR